MRFSKWRNLRKKKAIDREIARREDLMGKLDDPMERQIMGFFLIERAIPFAESWADAFNAVEEGATLTINPGDWPQWTADEA